MDACRESCCVSFFLYTFGKLNLREEIYFGKLAVCYLRCFYYQAEYADVMRPGINVQASYCWIAVDVRCIRLHFSRDLPYSLRENKFHYYMFKCVIHSYYEGIESIRF